MTEQQQDNRSSRRAEKMSLTFFFRHPSSACCCAFLINFSVFQFTLFFARQVGQLESFPNGRNSCIRLSSSRRFCVYERARKRYRTKFKTLNRQTVPKQVNGAQATINANLYEFCLNKLAFGQSDAARLGDFFSGEWDFIS